MGCDGRKTNKQQPSILAAVSPSANRGRAVLRWQGPSDHGPVPRYTELDRRHFTDCCDLVVFSSGQQNVNIIVRSPVLWAWILQLRFVKIKNENSFILEGQTWRRLNVDMSKLVTSLVVYIFNTRRKLLYVHVTMHRNKFVTFMWPCIVTSLSRSCDRAS